MRETSAFGEDLEAVFRSCFEGGGGGVGGSGKGGAVVLREVQ